MIWKAVCHYSTGVSHQKQDLPCQDYGEYRLLGKVVIGAVADGAGSTEYSHLGSQIAVKEILAYLEKFEQKFSCFSFQSIAQSVHKIFAEGTQQVISVLSNQAISNSCSINELACTLIAFIATSDWIAAMQIGDGFLVFRLHNDPSYQLLFHPDKGEFINETTFITSSNVLETMQVQTIAGSQRFICASTDGLENVCINLRNWLPFEPFFQPLENYLEQTNNPEQDKQYLIQFLESERLQSRTNDDKTLLLCLSQFS
ncbi:PP2C family serine/threonine-protein phosphatase [Iningainema tapete]|uniref:Protein phosphatase 2C domain-containing protein n=1 Tax=Iningainema tapete BLCC-T55 TaxID=2748662 RepID=A0A8J6XA81_9CYAN|nr:PP2C family serine/threonine-protein phosphatase [Iningainema tapete]MBD2770990.1 protein phosphatase 2C domain-containing protein [Iningainema tapete BLCC-T55]